MLYKHQLFCKTISWLSMTSTRWITCASKSTCCTKLLAWYVQGLPTPLIQRRIQGGEERGPRAWTPGGPGWSLGGDNEADDEGDTAPYAFSDAE
jgi:hypothetical protein